MAHENLIEGYKILRYGYKIIHIRNKYKHPADSKKTLTRYNAEMVSYLRSPSSKIKTNASKENRKLKTEFKIWDIHHFAASVSSLWNAVCCLFFSMYLDELF